MARRDLSALAREDLVRIARSAQGMWADREDLGDTRESEENVRTIYVFDCPYHGEEEVIFCFRAFNPDNKHRWKKLEVRRKEVPLGDKERDEIFAQFVGDAGVRDLWA